VLFSLVSWLVPLEANDDLSRSDTLPENTRPSWENNLNWWMDGNAAVEAALQTQPTHVMSSAATPAGSPRGADNPPAHRTDLLHLVGMLEFVAAGVLFGSMLFGPSSGLPSRSARQRGWLMPGLERWVHSPQR
jgi:hypothetical protein